MAKVERSVEINAPVEKVWKVISDYEKYPEFLRESKRVTVSNRTDKGCRIANEISVAGATVKYTLDMVETVPTKIRWSLVEGQFMKSNNGGWDLVSLGPNKTRADYQIELSVGMLVPKTILNALVDSNLPEMFAAFKKRIEGMP
jgi:ribosome-associated toxin RatA of RatAB toxin-antitoxin module